MNRHLTAFLSVLVAVILFLSVAAYAETAVVTPAKGVNLRSGPGTEYEVLMTIPYNTEVTVTGSQGSWYAVTVGGMSGYTSASYLRFITSTSDNGSAYTATGSAASGSTVSIFSGNTVNSSGTSSPGIFQNSGSGSATVSSGTAGSASSGTYASGSPSIFQNSGTTTSYYSTQTYGTAQSYGTTQQYSASTGAYAASTAGASASGTSFSGTVTGDYVRLRSGPSVSYSILATIRKGTAVTVTGSYGEWYKCTVNGTSGFVSAAYVAQTGISSTTGASVYTGSSSGTVSIFQNSGSAAGSYMTSGTTGAPSVYSVSGTVENSGTAAASSTESTASVKAVTQRLGYITGNNVRLRSGPSTSSEILGEFQYGNSIYITGISGEWVAVTADGKSGFVSGKYVSDGTYTPTTVSDSMSLTGSDSVSVDSADLSEETQISGQQTEQTGSGTSSSSSTAGGYTAVTGQQVANLAVSFVGTKYTYGGTDPENGFDCSGLVYYCYKQFGITLCRTAAEQATNGVHVDPSDLRPGDILCFYSTSSYIGHAGIYIGDGRFVHAATSGTGVIVTELSGYYSSKGYEARRIIT